MPDWIDRDEYPFAHRYADLGAGRMHYVDEGDASAHAIVMVHGNPAWSFLYRDLIKCLRGRYRCIAPDHLGFGLSDKPHGWDYLPQAHAANLEALLQRLSPRSVTLVVGDWGGPIGLSYALKCPERVRSLVITNTWMWSVRGDPHYELFSRIMGGAVGRTLIERRNFFVRVLMRSMFRARLSPEVHQHYIEPLREPSQRRGCSRFPREILGSSLWLEDLWSRRAAIADKPALILWGMRDIAFRRKELRRWQALFPQAEVHELPQAGHFVSEALGPDLCPLVEAHLAGIAP